MSMCVNHISSQHFPCHISKGEKLCAKMRPSIICAEQRLFGDVSTSMLYTVPSSKLRCQWNIPNIPMFNRKYIFPIGNSIGFPATMCYTYLFAASKPPPQRPPTPHRSVMRRIGTGRPPWTSVARPSGKAGSGTLEEGVRSRTWWGTSFTFLGG